MAEIYELKPRKAPIDWGQVLAPAFQGINQGLTAQSEVNKLLLPLVFKAQMERRFNPEEYELKKAQAQYYRDRIAGEKIGDVIKKTAWEQYQKGVVSPQILKALGMWVNPMEEMLASQMGIYGGQVPSAVSGAMGGGAIKVRRKADKITGTISPNEFDPSLYERI